MLKRMTWWWPCVALAFTLGCDDGASGTTPPPVDRGVALSDLGPVDGGHAPDVAVDAAVDAALDAAPDVEVDAAPPPECDNGLDDDGDGRIDLADLGCDGALDDDESDEPIAAQCANGVDDDGDGRVDLMDADCRSGTDDSEDGLNPITACSDGVDNDGDGLPDFPLDPGCAAAGDDDEVDAAAARACHNGLDDDGDGRTDYPEDPGCAGVGDADEVDPPIAPECSNGLDDDEDGATDFPADLTCESAGDTDETFACFGGRTVVHLNAHLAEHGSFDGDLSDGEAGFLGSCGGDAGPELVFSYLLDRRAAALVFSTQYAETVAPTVLYVRRACDLHDDLTCNRGAAGSPGTEVRLEAPAPGLYYVVVDTSSRAEGPGVFRLTAEVEGATACSDEIDNDDDGRIDLVDPGCVDAGDDDELDPASPPECGDGQDNDRDGLTDYPDDPECFAAGGAREGGLCDTDFPNMVTMGQAGGTVGAVFGPEAVSLTSAGCDVSTGPEFVVALTLDEPSDVVVRLRDNRGFPPPYIVSMRADCDDMDSEVGCVSVPEDEVDFDGLERGTYFLFIDHAGPDVPDVALWVDVAITSLLSDCNDLVDNDDDGLIDLDDPGCEGGLDVSELDPATPGLCSDGLDNDGDGRVDWPLDDGCLAAGDDDERADCMYRDDLLVISQEGGVLPISLDRNRYSTSCALAPGPERIVALDLELPSQVTIYTFRSNFDPVVALRSACDSGGELECGDDYDFWDENPRLEFDVLPPGRYFIVVEDAEGVGGETELNVEIVSMVTACNDEVDNDADGFVDLADPGCVGGQDPSEADPAVVPECADGIDNDADGLVDWPADDACTAAGDDSEAITCELTDDVVILGQAGGVVEGSTVGGVDHYNASCGNSAASPEAVVALVLTEPSMVIAEITEGGRDSTLHLRSACDDAGAEIECDDDGGVGLLSMIERPRMEPGVYFFFVDGYGSGEGMTFTFEITTTSLLPPPACRDGVDNDGDGVSDASDPGCVGPEDDDEADPEAVPECADGIDNDEDGLIDLDDFACAFAGIDEESQACAEVPHVAPDEAGTWRAAFETLSDDLTGGACGGEGRMDQVVRYVVSPEQAGGTLVADLGSTGLASVGVRTFCDDSGSELVCGRRVEVPAVSAGEYFFVVEAAEAATVSVGGEVASDVAAPDGGAYRPELGFSAVDAQGRDRWLLAPDGDEFGGLLLVSGETVQGASIVPGERVVEIDDRAVTVRSAFVAPAVLRVQLEGEGDAPLTVQVDAIMAAAADAQLDGRVDFGGLTLPYLSATVAGGATGFLMVVPAAASELPSLRLRAEAAGGLIQALDVHLPVTLYFGSTHGAAESLAEAVTADLARGQVELNISVTP